MNSIFSIAFLSVLTSCLARLNTGPSTLELIRSSGYPVETHTVTTEDGYILELHRMPRGRNETYKEARQKRVVFIAQCLFGSAATYVVLGPKAALAYKLADAGYDVWMMNGRGVSDSQRHVKFSPKTDEYWKFGWHEMAIYDTPTSIDYILKLTGESQVDFLGYSLGATLFYALLDEKPEYNAKLRSLIGLSPIAYINHSPNLIWSLSPLRETFAKIMANLRTLVVPPPELGLNELLGVFCEPKNDFIYRPICELFLSNIGANSKFIDRRNLPFFLKLFPEAVSFRSLVHLLQIRKTGRFEKYNFGKKVNMIKYGSPYPPLYNLSRVDTPISYIWGENDVWATSKDVMRLIKEHKNVVFTKIIPNFTHFDMIWGSTASALVYDTVIERLNLT